MSVILPISSAMLGLLVVAMLVPILTRLCRRNGWLSRSNDFHHRHAAPIPRVGGVVLVIGWLIVQGWIALCHPELRDRGIARPGFLLASLAMFLLGFWDDIHPLGARTKLMGQVLIAMAASILVARMQWLTLPFSGQLVALGPWSWCITVVWLVGITNLVNLVDGIDGLAGGISLVAMVFVAMVGGFSGVNQPLWCGLVGALLGFLLFNFPPARIFLGDGGAYFLGFQIGVGAMLNSGQGKDPATLIGTLLVLAVPLLDAGWAILRRALIGLPVLRPDRRHIHHHLLKRGWSPRRAVLCLYAMTLLTLGLALLMVRFPEQRWLLGSCVGGMLAVIWRVSPGAIQSWRAIRRRAAEAVGMRVQIQYALALARCLRLAGDRCETWEEIWEDLVFAARRLRFASVQLSWPGGARAWGTAPALDQAYTGIFDGHGRFPCQLTLTAEIAKGRHRHEFELLSELLAEAWTSAMERWMAVKGGTQSSTGIVRKAPLELAMLWNHPLGASSLNDGT